MAKIEPHKSPDKPEITKIAKQAAAEMTANKQSPVIKAPIKNPNATTKVHTEPIK